MKLISQRRNHLVAEILTRRNFSRQIVQFEVSPYLQISGLYWLGLTPALLLFLTSTLISGILNIVIAILYDECYTMKNMGVAFFDGCGSHIILHYVDRYV